MSVNNQMSQSTATNPQLPMQSATQQSYSSLPSNPPSHQAHHQAENITTPTQQRRPDQRPSPSTSGIGSHSGIEADPGQVIDVDAEVDSGKSWIRRDPHQWTVSLCYEIYWQLNLYFF